MTCTHERIKTWLLADTHEPAGMWSCAHCGEKFMPITQAWAEKRAGAIAMRERAAKLCLVGVQQREHYDGPKNEEFDVRDSEAEYCADIIRALPGEE